MGVADNRTYKNEYLFNDKQNSVFGTTGTTEGDNPSINTDPKINSTIKENPYKSNVEIEGREVVLQPDLSALFKAVGKRHSRGGMDVLLKPDSFVFSDFKDLALTPKEHDTFELKKGGKYSTDTPAEVLKRNVDLKHYNSLVSILGDPHKDDLAKKSAVRMLEKYIKTLGNVAYIQENKKGFPDGLPSFSEGTAPMDDTELKEQIMANKQYAKAGGTIKNPYLQRGGNPSTPNQDPYTGWNWLFNFGKTNPVNTVTDYSGRGHDNIPTIPIVSLNPTTTPTTPNPVTRQDKYTGQRPPYPDTWTNYYDKTQKQQYAAPDWIKPKDFYATPGLIDYMKTLDKQSGVDWDMNKADDAVWGWRHQAALAKFFPNGKPVTPPATVTPPGTPTPPATPPPIPPPAHNNDHIETGVVDGTPQGSKVASWKFTPWQNRSHLYDMFNWLNVNKYGADRAHYNATFINPALVNPEQTVGDTKAVAWQQAQAANVLNPILRNAQGADAYGKVLNTIPGIRSQYDNQNVGIVNQFRQYNNQVKNNESLTNMQNDMNYAKDSTAANVNYDNMKTHLANTAMSNLMSDVSKNQSLAYKLLQQNNPAYNFNWNTGNFDRTWKSILDASTGDAKSDMYTELANSIMGKIRKGISPSKEEVDFMKSLAIGKMNFSTPSQDIPYKKGGKIKRNPYK